MSMPRAFVETYELFLKVVEPFKELIGKKMFD